MPSEFNNSHLAAAKAAKNDEFYTQWADIEREMNAYLEFDPDVFRGKVDPAAVRRPRVEQLRQVLRPALHGLRPQEAHLDVVRPRQQRRPTSTTSHPVRDREPRVRRHQDPSQRQEVRPGSEGHQRRRRHQHRRPPVGVPRRRRRLPQPRGHGAARRGRHRHHQPAVQPVPGVRRLARRGRQEVLDHRQHERRHLQRDLPAHQGQPSSGRARASQQRRHGSSAFPKATTR